MKQVLNQPLPLRLICVLLSVLLFLNEMTAQVTAGNISVTGKITSSDDGTALRGATVTEKGTTNITSTNENGMFNLTVPSNATLAVSYTGFTTKEIDVAGRSVVNVSLEAFQQQLEDVIVIAYGTQQKVSVTGSISTISAKELKDMPVSNIGQKMQGKAAGVQIYQTTGEPGGGGLAFRIRGAASINAGNSPLVVIDGFPSLTGLSAISPDAIETITILKDASASSLYGSRAANGVILITTKQAREGQRNIEFSSYFGMEVVGDRGKPDVMNAPEFAQFKKEYYEDQARYEGYTGGVPARYQNPQSYAPDAGTNWYDVLLRKARTQDYNLTLSSGVKTIKSVVNLNYNRQEGVILNTYSERFTGRSNNIYTASDRLTFGLNLAMTYRNSQVTPGLGGGRNIIASAFLMDPTLEYKNADGSYPLSFSQPGMFANPNYYLVLTQRQNPTKIVNTLANVFGEFEILKDLKYKITGNLDLENSSNRMFAPSTSNGAIGVAPPTPAIGSYSSGNHLSWLVENTLTYSKIIKEKHDLNAFVGYTTQKATIENSTINATQYPDDNIGWISAATTRLGNAGNSQWTLLSYIGRLNYSFNNKYLVSLAFRRDGSSRFGANAKWANFPSVSLGWVVSDESFMSGINNLNFLKLRASYGKLGNNNIGNYSYLASLSSANYVFGNSVVPGSALSGIGNNNLTWETTTQYDAGIDLGLFNNRISFTYDYYWKKTEGLLYGIDIPSQAGFTTITSNIGRFDFWGHEFALETKNLTGKFKWNTSFNISFNRNEAIKLGTNNTPIGGYATAGDDINRTQVGHPIGQFFGWIYDGVYMTDQEYVSQPKHARSTMVGTARFKDVSGPNGKPDGIVDDLDKTVIGDPNPDFLYGLTNQFTYKNFDASITIAGAVGGDINDGTREWTENLDGVFNVRKEVAERWRSLEDPGAGNIARTRSGTTSPSRWHISRFVFDGSYLAAKNITIGYTFPLRVTNNIKGARLFLSAQNAFIISNYKGMNPEVSQAGLNGLSIGRDLSAYPIPRTFTVGVNVSF